uniref:Scar-like domain-containing protein WAVE 5 n=1 Tax=Lygus hesperus TaxID=30085 RepID=A0A0A9W4Q3_LYGHE
MKEQCNIILCVVVLCAMWGTARSAVGEEVRQSPLASYNYGVTGEPSKIDTAFGNLGEVGPSYDVPSKNGTSGVTSSSEQALDQNETASEESEQTQVTSGSNSTAPTQSFNTSNTPTSSTTEKSIDLNTTPKTTVDGSASTAGDRGTTVPIEMSTTETEFPTEIETNAQPTAIPGGQSVTPSQTFETGVSSRKPTASPVPMGNGTKPTQHNGTLPAEPNSSIAVQPLTNIYCLVSIVLFLSKTMY